MSGVGGTAAGISYAARNIIVLAKLTSVCYITRYANGKNKTTNRELRQIPAGIRTCCHTQKGLRRLLTFSMASTISNLELKHIATAHPGKKVKSIVWQGVSPPSHTSAVFRREIQARGPMP